MSDADITTALATRSSAEPPAADASLPAQPVRHRKLSPYKLEVMQRICDEIAQGRSLADICRQDWSPEYATVMRWIGKYEDFRDSYDRARESQADKLADEIVSIADEMPTITVQTRHGEHQVIDMAAIQRNRLRVDARKWVAAKLKPKIYGDAVAHTGPDGGPMQVMVAAWMSPQGKPEPDSE